MLWAIQSIKSHNLDKIIFAIHDAELVNSVLRPRAWPSFKSLASYLIHELSKIKEWRLEGEIKSTNIGASLIANSVMLKDRRQSYVVTGAPVWLQDVFGSERNIGLG